MDTIAKKDKTIEDIQDDMNSGMQDQLTAVQELPGYEGETLHLQDVLNTVYGFVAIVAVVFVVIGGFFYINAQGDPAKITKAKSAIGAALAGLLIVALAGAITNFIFMAIGGAK